MKSDCLVDTDVFIDFLRGRSEAVEFVRSKFPRIHISAITVGELYSGIREGTERRTLESALNACHVIDVSMNIAIMAGLFRRALREKPFRELGGCPDRSNGKGVWSFPGKFERETLSDVSRCLCSVFQTTTPPLRASSSVETRLVAG